MRQFFKDVRARKKAALLDKLVSFSFKGPHNVKARQTLMAALKGAKKKKDVDDAFEALYAAVPDLKGEVDYAVRAAKKIVRMTELKGPYFPLVRFGDYVVAGVDKADDEEYVAFHETMADAQADFDRLKADKL